MSKTKKIPNLFYCGMGRSGSTSLYNYFKDHPDIYVPRKKELHYFSREIMEEVYVGSKSKLKHFVLDEDSYLKYFEEAKDEKIIADLSPMDGYSEHAARRIYNFNPKAKIIFSFRKPVDYMYSLHSALASVRVEKNSDFIDAVNSNAGTNKDSWPKPGFYKEFSYYAKHFKRFVDVFPRENIFVYFYQDFRKNNAAVYKNILDFLEVAYYPPKKFKRHNYNRKIKGTFVLDTAEYIFSKLDLSFLMKNKFVIKLAETYLNSVTVPVEREPLPDNVVKKLKKEQKPRVEEFERLLKKHKFLEKDSSLLEKWEYV